MPKRSTEGRLAIELGARARQARTALKLSQEEVAELVDLATQVYGRLERGNMTPSLATLMRLAAVLKVTPAFLLGEAGASVPPTRKSAPADREIKQVVRLMERLPANEKLRVRNVVAAFVGARERALREGSKRR